MNKKRGSIDAFEHIEQHQVAALQPVASPSKRGMSKIGGLPNLPSGTPWPSWQGKSLSFIAQINLQEAPQQEGDDDPLKSGVLYFFYDQDQSTWGFDPKDRGSWKVIYAADGFSKHITAAPVGLDEEFIYAEKFIGFREIASRPSAERIGLNLDEMSYEDYENHDAFLLEPYGGLPKHQLGGYPFPVQNDAMEVESQLASSGLYVGDASGYEDPRADELVKGAEEWGLLLQIDSDDDTGMMWGDRGLIYFWIKHDDLMRGHFDDVWMILQSN